MIPRHRDKPGLIWLVLGAITLTACLPLFLLAGVSIWLVGHRPCPLGVTMLGLQPISVVAFVGTVASTVRESWKIWFGAATDPAERIELHAEMTRLRAILNPKGTVRRG